MYVRNYKGQIVYFDTKSFISEYEKYTKLWKIKYNIDLDKPKDRTPLVHSIISYVKGEKNYV